MSTGPPSENGWLHVPTLVRYLQYRVRLTVRRAAKDEMTESQTTSKGIEFNENIVALLGCAILLVSAVLWADRPPTMEKTDFSVTYIGSRMVYLGQGSKLYDLAEQQKLKRLLLPDAEPLIYEHPPFEALLLAPLGALSYKTAYLTWGLINVTIWLMLPFVLRPYAPAPRDDLGYLVLWLLFAPLGVTLFQGQSSLVMLLVYSLAFISMKQRRDYRAGAILGLGLFKFQFILPFALIFLLWRQWRFLKGFLATAAGLGVLSLLAVGWTGIWSYIHLIVSIVRHPDNVTYGAAIDMGTVQGFVHALLGKVLGRPVISLLVAAISVSLIGWSAWHWRTTDATGRARTFDLMFAVSVVVALVTGFHMFTHDLSPLLLAMLLVAAHFPGSSRPALRLTLGTALVLFWIPPLYFALVAWHCMYLWFLVLAVFMVGTFKLVERPPEEIRT
jgi:Glycosyltransferase family 87